MLIKEKILNLLFNRRELERKALLGLCKGKGIDVGCGSDKVCPQAIGVDITPKGASGKYGNQKNQISQADICASGDKLPFKNNSLDYVLARHNLEHYEDYIKTLKEWKRVLIKSGKLGIIVPDERYLKTMKLDPTHKHAFTPKILENSLKSLSFKIIKQGIAIPKWSFFIIAEK